MTTKPITHRQCGLVLNLENDTEVHLVSFLPARFAKRDRIVKLKQENGEWEDGWRVVEVGAGVDKDHLPDSHREIKAHRNRTGDGLVRKGK